MEATRQTTAAQRGIDSQTDKRHQARISTVHSLLVLFICVLTYFLFAHVPLFRQLELNTLDQRFRRRPTIYMSPRLGTIDIDMRTIQQAGMWPISRRFYAEAIRVLHTYGATLMSYDVFFPDPSPVTASQDQIANALALLDSGDPGPRLRAALQDMARSADDEFVEAMRQSDLVVLAQSFTCSKLALFPDEVDIAKRTRSKLNDLKAEQREALALAREFSIPYPRSRWSHIGLARAFNVEPPHPRLLKEAKALGYAQVVQDVDGATRQYPLFILFNRRLYPALAVMGLSIATGVPLESIEIVPGKHVRFPDAKLRDRKGNVVVSDLTIPVDRHLRMMCNWAGDYLDTFLHIPLSMLLRFRGIDLIREMLHSYRDDPATLISTGIAEITRTVVDRKLLDAAHAEEIVQDLMLAQLVEFYDENGADKDDLLDALEWENDEARRDAARIWDQVVRNHAMLARLKADPGITYAQLKEDLSVPDSVDDAGRHAFEFLRFILRQNKDPESWRPLYFFPPVPVAHEGGTAESTLSPLDLAEKILYVGLTAPGTHDHNPMPFSPVYPMVGLHVNAANTMLTRQFIHVLPGWGIFLIVLACALPMVYATPRLHPLLGAVFMLAFVGAYLLAGVIAFNRFGLWLPVMQPLVTVALSYPAILIHGFLYEQKEKRRVRTAFSTYMTPTVVSQVLEDPGMLRLGGQRRRMTVFFSDLEGFTGISEQHEPEELVAILNEYFDSMTNTIFQHEGTLDKYEGDAIMAFWNAPADQHDHAYRSCCAALDCIEHLEKVLQPKWVSENRPPLSMRIGINTGQMIVGNMGSTTRMDYTVMGDAVNLGARLEGVNKVYRTNIMISEYTRADLADSLVVREVDILRVKGKQKPVAVYEVVSRPQDLAGETRRVLECFDEGRQHYRQAKWDKAIACFSAALDIDPSDGPSAVYIDRCRTYKTAPPPANWDGVWVLTSK